MYHLNFLRSILDLLEDGLAKLCPVRELSSLEKARRVPHLMCHPVEGGGHVAHVVNMEHFDGRSVCRLVRGRAESHRGSASYADADALHLRVL